MTVSRLFLLRIGNAAHKTWRANQNTHFVFNIPPQKSHRLWERDNVEIYGTASKITDGNIIRLIRFACWVTMVSHIHSYLIFTAFPQQLWLRERASMLRYTYITSLVNPHTYLLSKLRVARGYCTVNDNVVHYKWLLCAQTMLRSLKRPG